ncbi:hypothetical protein E1265_21475 [Streptomyces sp. 8K308]|uniref:LAETG motif-containing sortase-dependent surface protein n=1 Tax=Streptomyces sp. 8K308 TaxID=2530388 RepID=UPI00104A3841|nr:LAETG motif-containing sortase-dependent surface protein [Streptomyces sp. 8K308]TDC20599.1 hypothetical protein E1265_21475 [Streptomyces sp. 8K308]
MFKKSQVRAAVALALGALAIGTSPAVAADPEDLVHRPEESEVTAVSGNWIEHQPGYLGGQWLLFHRGENVTLTGTGYFQIRWEIEYWVHDGLVSMPTYTDQDGTFLHVASGGGVRMDDPYPGGEEGRTRMGRESTGEYTTLPEDEPMLWIQEYYYLDGSITITNQERTNGGTAAYNLGVTPVDYDTVMSGLVGDGSASFHRGVAHDVEGVEGPEEETSSTAAPASEEPVTVEPAGEAEPAAGDREEGGADLAETGSDGSTPVLAAAAAAFVVVGGGTLLWVRGRRRA